MNEFGLNDLYKFLSFTECEITKINDRMSNIDLVEVKHLYKSNEDEFFQYLESNLKGKYLDILVIYLSLAVDLYQKYLNENIDIKIYFDTITDLRIWIDNCYKETNIFGLKEYYWLNEHLRMRIFKLGRLQFQKRVIDDEFLQLLNNNNLSHHINKNHLYFVHIPQGEKLSYNLVLDSYKKAKDFFQEEMIFACESWMMSDRLELIFDNNSNILKFRSDYQLLHQDYSINPIVRYLYKDSALYNKVLNLEQNNIKIGDGFGVCIKYK